MAWIESQSSAQSLMSMTVGESKAGLADDVQVCGNLDQHFTRECLEERESRKSGSLAEIAGVHRYVQSSR
jgi:hypothetical protein